MMNKKLVFCSFFALFQVIGGMQANAVDVIRAEDEDILWEANAYSGETLRGVETDLNNAEYDGYGRRIIRVERREPSLGVPVQAIRVPDEVNAQAPLYDNPEIIKTYDYAPRNVAYATGEERNARESLKEPFDPELMIQGYTPKMINSHQGRVAFYRTEINNCMSSRQDQLEVEMGMLDNGGNHYENAAYLSQTMEEIEQCYDNIGLEIIDEFYGHDNEVLRNYNRQSAAFHVDGVSAGFNPKYCGESCSVKAIAELQVDKFEEFRIYLYKLLDKAPIVPVRAAREEFVPPVSNEFEPQAYQPQAAYRAQPQQRAVPKVLRVRTPEGEIKYARSKGNGEYELLEDDNKPAKPTRRAPKAENFQPWGQNGAVEVAPIRLDYDGVPLIDEDDL